MNQSEIKLGMMVVVNDSPDAMVYYVKSINEFNVCLEYRHDNGAFISAGESVDVCILKKASKAQQITANEWV